MNRSFSSRLFLLLAFLSTALFPSVASAQISPEAQAIFDRYAEALGGYDAYDKIESAKLQMNMEIPAVGMNMQTDVTFLNPDKFYLNVTVPGMGNMTQAFDGEKGWSKDVMQGLRELRGAELKKMRSDADFQEGVRLKEKYSTAKVDGEDADGLIRVLATTIEEGHEETLYFEKDTGLLRKHDTVEYMGAQGMLPAQMEVTEYATYGEIKMPTRMEIGAMGMVINVGIVSFQPNVAVDESIFAMPAQ